MKKVYRLLICLLGLLFTSVITHAQMNLREEFKKGKETETGVSSQPSLPNNKVSKAMSRSTVFCRIKNLWPDSPLILTASPAAGFI